MAEATLQLSSRRRLQDYFFGVINKMHAAMQVYSAAAESYLLKMGAQRIDVLPSYPDLLCD